MAPLLAAYALPWMADADRHTLSLYIRCWALPLIADSADRASGRVEDVVRLCLALLACAFPVPPVLLLLAATDVALAVSQPFASWMVHRYIAALMHGAVLLSAVAVVLHARRLPVARDFLLLLRWPARVVAAAVFFAGFVKLNRDFLDPRISCAGSYYLWLRQWPGLDILPDTDAAKQGAIFATLMLEMLGPLLLWPRRTRMLGLAALWLFAFGLSANTRSIYFEFIGLFWACSLFWLEPRLLRDTAAVFTRVGARIRNRLMPVRMAKSTAFVWALKVTAVAAMALVIQLGRGAHYGPPVIFAWLLAGMLAIASVAIAALRAARLRARARGPARSTRVPQDVSPDEPRDAPASSAGRWRFVVMLVPAFLMFNECSSYAGLAHRPALKMASNSNLGAVGTNHLVLPYLPTLPWTADIQILRSNLRGLRSGDHVSRLLLRHMLVGHPEAKLKIRATDGAVTEISSPQAVDEIASRSWVVELFALSPYRPHTQRILCDKAEPGLSPRATQKRMRERLARVDRLKLVEHAD